MTLWIKICGVTSVDDARMVLESGADAIGLNFAAASPRVIDPDLARSISEIVRGRLEVVGVFVDLSQANVSAIAQHVGLDFIQLHGHEPPDLISAFQAEGRSAFKAIRIADEADVARAGAFPGERLLVDAKVAGAMGGTGATFDWSLIAGLTLQRKVVLAGGLSPSNVESAVQLVRPFGIDTASGVEIAPGRKAPDLVREFVRRARAASQKLG